MLPDETNPTTVEETTQGGGEVTASQESDDRIAEESHAAGSEASQETLSLEQLQQREAEYQKKIADLNAGLTQHAQQNADLRRQNEQYQGALGQFVDQQRAAIDPLTAAQKAYRDARENFDTDAEMDALNRITDIKAQNAIQQSVQLNMAATQAQQIQQKHGYTIDQLRAHQANMSVEDVANSLLIRDGKFEDVTAAEKAQREQKAREAALFAQLAGEGGTGTVPGGFAPQPEKRINDITFGLLPKAKKQELLDEGFRVFNNRTGEDLTPG